MLGDLRVLDLGDELLLDTERVALQELFNMIRRYKLGRDVELHKRTLELGLLSLIGPRGRRRSGSRRSTTTAATRSPGSRSCWCGPTSASTCSCPADAKAAVAAELGVPEVERGDGRDRARRARPAALRRSTSTTA